MIDLKISIYGMENLVKFLKIRMSFHQTYRNWKHGQH